MMEMVIDTDMPKNSPVISREITGSQAILEALSEEGVDTIFGIPGGANIAII
jgi:hypothetical protein